MTSEQKTAIAKLFSSEDLKAFEANLIGMNVFNIELGESLIKFEMIHEFVNHERVELEKRLVRVFEMFCEFSTTKNALACLTYISEGNAVTDDLFENESKYPPYNPVPSTFNALLATLRGTGREETLLINIDAWYKIHLSDGLCDLFDAREINTAELAGGLAKGDLIRYTPIQQVQSHYAAVLSAPTNGWIMCLDLNSGYFLLPNSQVQKLDAETFPQEAKKALEAKVSKFEGRGLEQKEAALDKLVKTEAKNEKLMAKATRMLTAKKLNTIEKIDAGYKLLNGIPSNTGDTKELLDLYLILKEAQKLLDGQDEVMKVLHKMPTKTEAQVEALVQAVNDAALTTENKAEIKKVLKAAQVLIKADKKAKADKEAKADEKAVKADKAEVKAKTPTDIKAKKAEAEAEVKAKAANRRKATPKATEAAKA